MEEEPENLPRSPPPRSGYRGREKEFDWYNPVDPYTQTDPIQWTGEESQYMSGLEDIEAWKPPHINEGRQNWDEAVLKAEKR